MTDVQNAGSKIHSSEYDDICARLKTSIIFEKKCSLNSGIDFCTCEWPTESLRSSSFCANSVSVPVLPISYLQMKDAFIETSNCNVDDSAVVHSSESDAEADNGQSMATLSSRRLLCGGKNCKPKYELVFELCNSNAEFEPGDAFDFFCSNPAEEVNYLLMLLNISVEVSCVPKQLSVHPETEKKQAEVPKHLKGVRSLRQMFESCVDFRKTPTRGMLRMLAEYASDSGEQARLLQLCSSEGMKEYQKYVREPQLSLLDIYHAFPSCRPPVERLLELLPPLLPRAYSVASSPLVSLTSIRFILSLVQFEAGNGRFYAREGICCGWLRCLTPGTKVPICLRKPSRFRLPKCPFSKNLIFVGPGSGVAPFLGFLQHLSVLRNSSLESNNVKRLLFFGCRSKTLDFIYKGELESAVDVGSLTLLSVSFSKESPTSKNDPHVQDAIRSNSEQLFPLLTNGDVIIYVCGDAKNMAKDVFKACYDVLQSGGMNEKEAFAHILEMQKNGQYLQDIWR